MGVHSNPFYWWFYSHSMDYSTPFVVHCWELWINSTDDSTPNLCIILLSFYWSFYSKSIDDLLACYWWFYFHSTDHSEHLLAGEEISRARNQLTKHTSPLAPMLPRQVASGGVGFVDWWLVLRTSAEKFATDLFYWWFYSLSTDCTPILLMIRSPFYWQYSIDHSTLILLIILMARVNKDNRTSSHEFRVDHLFRT